MGSRQEPQEPPRVMWPEAFLEVVSGSAFQVLLEIYLLVVLVSWRNLSKKNTAAYPKFTELGHLNFIPQTLKSGTDSRANTSSSIQVCVCEKQEKQAASQDTVLCGQRLASSMLAAYQ